MRSVRRRLYAGASEPGPAPIGARDRRKAGADIVLSIHSGQSTSIICRVNTLNNIAYRLVEIGRDFHRRGWALGTSGNFSVVMERNPLTLAITESSVDKSRLRIEQILRVDEFAKVLEGGAGKPSAETLLHI